MQRTDSAQSSRCGLTPCLILIPYDPSQGYYGGLSLPVGGYVVTYQPPDGYRLAGNAVNPQSVTVPNPPPLQMRVYFVISP